MGLEEIFSSMCTPAQLYFALSAISIIAAFFVSYSLFNVIVGLAVAAIWSGLLNLVCQVGYPTVSWIILAIPIVMALGGGAAIAAKAARI